MTKKEFQDIQIRIKSKGDYMINRLVVSNKGIPTVYMRVFHVVWHADGLSFYIAGPSGEVNKVEVKRKNISKLKVDFPEEMPGLSRADAYRLFNRFILGYEYK